MAIKSNAAFITTQGYGLTGCKIELNLAQCQKLSSLYTRLYRMNEIAKASVERFLTLEESELLPFLSLFEGFASPDSEDLWANLLQKDAERGIASKSIK